MYKESFEDYLQPWYRFDLLCSKVIALELIFLVPHIILTGLIGLSGVFPLQLKS